MRACDLCWSRLLLRIRMMKAVVFGLFVVTVVTAAPLSVTNAGAPSPSNVLPQGSAMQPFLMNQMPFLQKSQLVRQPHVVSQLLPTFPVIQTALVPQMTPAEENALAHQAFFQMWHAQAARNSHAPTQRVPAETSEATATPASAVSSESTSPISNPTLRNTSTVA